jgi:hypothetical protein
LLIEELAMTCLQLLADPLSPYRVERETVLIQDCVNALFNSSR